MTAPTTTRRGDHSEHLRPPHMPSSAAAAPLCMPETGAGGADPAPARSAVPNFRIRRRTGLVTGFVLGFPMCLGDPRLPGRIHEYTTKPFAKDFGDCARGSRVRRWFARRWAPWMSLSTAAVLFAATASCWSVTTAGQSSSPTRFFRTVAVSSSHRVGGITLQSR
jgi:hypothetical protein